VGCIHSIKLEFSKSVTVNYDCTTLSYCSGTWLPNTYELLLALGCRLLMNDIRQIGVPGKLCSSYFAGRAGPPSPSSSGEFFIASVQCY